MFAEIEGERDALKIELQELKAKVSEWAVNHPWILEKPKVEKVEKKKDDIGRINKAISPPEGISVSEWCSRTHIQLCHCCDDLTCTDNLRKEVEKEENESKR
jgi:hypothetical protein